MAEAYNKLGVRYKRFTTRETRWSKGKVHLAYWSKEYKRWVPYCRFINDPDQYDAVHRITPVTCQACIMSIGAE